MVDARSGDLEQLNHCEVQTIHNPDFHNIAKHFTNVDLHKSQLATKSSQDHSHLKKALVEEQLLAQLFGSITSN